MKNKKLRIFLVSAALCGAASISAMAATGWQQVNENGTLRYVYYNSYGDLERSAWVRGSSDNEWRWLNADGYMAVNSLVDDGQYCVDENGRMVVNQWRQVNIDGKLKWMYFSSNGKAVTDGWKQISGAYYYFNDDGVMETGWVDDNRYYCAENGVMKTGWQFILPPDEYEEDNNGPQTSGSNGKYWFYFQDSGKVVRAEDSDDYVEKRIGDARYCFDEDGIMQTGWVKLYDDRDPAITGYRFCADSENISGHKYGEMLTATWWSAEAPDDDDFDSADVNWYYLGRTGEPLAGEITDDGNGNQLFTEGLERIDGKVYLFNNVGNPVSGLRKVKTSSGNKSMYFGENAPEPAQKGTQRIDDGVGNKETFEFNSSGYGYDGVHDGKLYYMGRLQKATEGSRAFIRVNGEVYLVNSSGSILKNKEYKSDGEIEYKSDSSGRRSGGYGDILDAEEPEYTVD